ncbi:hypothetical protein CLU83_0076 [Flavobacterium sp. 1]|uniref:hypothetical protein n=1 Tax=Flavobacterium sp. 1 TaxID=2035200 RepID=UPI000C2378A4|nr:hypothetical protein [Flavobacterium sp. 1]PJJ06954.1 hypothetical protein CLU83_0076 [Flavobacterium sp. 1]
MKFTFFKTIILIAFLECCFFSCSSDLDFDQVNDLNVQPVFVSNLAYINIDAQDFISNGTETPIFSYTSDVDFLSKSFVKENLVKTELYFRIKNTINRSYAFNVTFLNKNGTPIYNIKMDIPAYNGSEVIVEKTETFTATNVSILENTAKMVFSVRMFAGPPITAATPGRIEFSSGITAYFDIR